MLAAASVAKIMPSLDVPSRLRRTSGTGAGMGTEQASWKTEQARRMRDDVVANFIVRYKCE